MLSNVNPKSWWAKLERASEHIAQFDVIVPPCHSVLLHGYSHETAVFRSSRL